MHLKVNNEISLTEIRGTDKLAYLEHLKVKDISDTTLRIPYPYTEMDADEWLKRVRIQNDELGEVITFAIRNSEGFLIGGVGFDDLVPGRSHKAEIGYWLAKPYWGRGIMTEAVKCAAEHAFDRFKLVRLSANVFASNDASCRVLEKAGFLFEGVSEKYYEKNREYIDAKLFGKVR